MRLGLFSKIISAIFLFVICGLFYTQITKGNFYYQLSQKNRIRLIPQDAARGNIFDRNGKILADSRLSFAVSIIPQELSDKEATFNLLAKILAMDKSGLLKVYRLGYSAPFAAVMLKDNLTKSEAMLLEENKYRLEGAVVQVAPRRNYPLKDTLSHLIGYLRQVDKSRITRLKDYGYNIKDIMGYDGVEEAYDRRLRAEKGGMQIEVDNRGRMVRLLGMRPAHKGSDIKLTINSDMQRIAYSALGDKKGCVIIMEPFSGAILAMVSRPGYDPNMFAQNQNNEISRLLGDDDAPLFNRAISGLYPPASLFKLITTVAALENKKISSQTSVFCGGSIKVGNREFKCWDRHGMVNLAEAVLHSCDVFFYQAGLLAGPQALSEYAFKFGLGRSCGIDIDGEAAGFVPTVNWKLWQRHENWFKGDTANFAIGQGALLVTPLQMARLISVFANEGYLVKPYLAEGGSIRGENTAPKKIALKDKDLEILKGALRRVVKDEGGTAHILDLPDLSVSGKTGTAQTSRGLSHAWFIGFAPSNKPKIAFCVFVEHGGGSAASCAVAKEILEKFLTEGILEEVRDER